MIERINGYIVSRDYDELIEQIESGKTFICLIGEQRVALASMAGGWFRFGSLNLSTRELFLEFVQRKQVAFIEPQEADHD